MFLVNLDNLKFRLKNKVVYLYKCNAILEKNIFYLKNRKNQCKYFLKLYLKGKNFWNMKSRIGETIFAKK